MRAELIAFWKEPRPFRECWNPGSPLLRGYSIIACFEWCWYVGLVSPTVFRYRQYRFFFFSREEPRMHVHVFSPDGEAKFWIEPQIELAVSKGLRGVELNELQRIIEEHQDEIRQHWHRHFHR